MMMGGPLIICEGAPAPTGSIGCLLGRIRDDLQHGGPHKYLASIDPYRIKVCHTVPPSRVADHDLGEMSLSVHAEQTQMRPPYCVL